MQALIVSLALVRVDDEAEAVELARRVDVRARLDVGRILADNAADDAVRLGLLGFGTVALVVELDA